MSTRVTTSLWAGMTNMVQKRMGAMVPSAANESEMLYQRDLEEVDVTGGDVPRSAQLKLISSERLEHETMAMIRGALYSPDAG